MRHYKAPSLGVPGKSHGQRSLEGCSPWGLKESDMTEQLHFHFHALEQEMATHSSILAWRIPGMVEPGGLPSMGSHRVGHDWNNLAAAASAYLRLLIFLPAILIPACASSSPAFCMMYSVYSAYKFVNPETAVFYCFPFHHQGAIHITAALGSFIWCVGW